MNNAPTPSSGGSAGVIDIHVHFGSPPDSETGCFWSEEFTRTAAYLAMRLVTRSLFQKITPSRIRKHLLGVIRSSALVDKCVLLALDKVYEENGVARPDQTHLYVPNNVLARLAGEEERILFGCSVHPYRYDWKEELEFCLARKAVLCKWIPSSQKINPSHPNCRPFYRFLADHRLPLLCHAGPEYAIPTSDNATNEFNNPRYLRPALDEGVTVILAHCAVPYFWLLDEDYQDDFQSFLDLFDESVSRAWNLYADVSALCTPLRSPYIDQIRDHVPESRLVFGSDYPIPIFEMGYKKGMSLGARIRFFFKLLFMKNPLDKNYLLIERMGLGQSLFTRAGELFAAVQP